MDERIIADMKVRFGPSCREAEPVSGGWLNAKWKVTTDAGVLLVKRYSPKRYDIKKLEHVEAALQWQVIAGGHGVPCPRVMLHGGRAIRVLDGETAYVVMAFCEGRVGSPGLSTPAQLRSLGDALGRLHTVFARLAQHTAKGFPIDDGQVIGSLMENFATRAAAFSKDAPAAYRSAVLAMEPVLRRLTPSFFEKIPKGIAHEDFSGDNLLFVGDRVSAILDFDRCQYSYLWHDIGRAVLSLALLNGKLDIAKARAFAQGYALHRPFMAADIAHALRLTWCLETPWWIQPAFFLENAEKVTRFRDEMLWLTARFFRLEEDLEQGWQESPPYATAKN